MTLLTWETSGAVWLLLSPFAFGAFVAVALAVGYSIGRSTKRKRLEPKRYVFDRRLGI